MSRGQRLGTVVCLLLAVFASTAAVTHFHPDGGDGGPKARHCLICVTAHTPPVLISTIAPPPILARMGSSAGRPDCTTQSWFFSHGLFIRPPPVRG